MDSEQSYPAEADRDSDALEQTGQIYQSFGLSETRAREDERTHKNQTANGLVDCPSVLAPSGEPAAEHEAGGRQRHESG